MTQVSRARFVIGLASIAVLVALSVVLPRRGGIRQRAVVEPGRTFTFRAEETGRYMTTLTDGAPARGKGTLRQKLLQFRRAELIELELAPGLENGTVVQAGELLATFRLPEIERQLAETRALRESMEAQRALLAAGGRPEEVAEARRRVELARAVRQGEQPQLERLRALSGDDLVTEAELEAAELRDEVRRLEIALAQAQLAVVTSSARPEQLESIDAELTAVDTRQNELEELLAQTRVITPISGILEVGGNRNLVRVYDIDTVYLRIPLPEADRYRIDNGARVRFETPSCRSRVFVGEIVDIGENATNLNGSQIFWTSAAIDNADHVLRSGMTGNVRVDLQGGGGGMLRSMWRKIGGP